MRFFKISCLLILIVVVFNQECQQYSIGKPCSSNSGNGVCCGCNGYPMCVIGKQQCCGNCGSCQSTQKCCSRGEFYSEGYCLSGGDQCCLQGTDKAYPCPSGQYCCDNGMCCKNTVTVWALILLIAGCVMVVSAIALFIFKYLKNKKSLQNYQKHQDSH